MRKMLATQVALRVPELHLQFIQISWVCSFWNINKRG